MFRTSSFVFPRHENEPDVDSTAHQFSERVCDVLTATVVPKCYIRRNTGRGRRGGFWPRKDRSGRGLRRCRASTFRGGANCRHTSRRAIRLYSCYGRGLWNCWGFVHYGCTIILSFISVLQLYCSRVSCYVCAGNWLRSSCQ